jgi:hypothetical protein
MLKEGCDALEGGEQQSIAWGEILSGGGSLANRLGDGLQFTSTDRNHDSDPQRQGY